MELSDPKDDGKTNPIVQMRAAAQTFRQITDFDEAARFLELSPFEDNEAALNYLAAGLVDTVTVCTGDTFEQQQKSLCDLLKISPAVAKHLSWWIISNAMFPAYKTDADDDLDPAR